MLVLTFGQVWAGEGLSGCHLLARLGELWVLHLTKTGQGPCIISMRYLMICPQQLVKQAAS